MGGSSQNIINLQNTVNGMQNNLNGLNSIISQELGQLQTLSEAIQQMQKLRVNSQTDVLSSVQNILHMSLKWYVANSEQPEISAGQQNPNSMSYKRVA